MRYCTLSNLRVSIPGLTLIWLSNDDENATNVQEYMVVEAVSQMEYLNSTNRREPYNASLGSGSVFLRSLFNDIAVNLARYWFYTRSTERADIPEAVIFACKFSEHLPESTLADKLTIRMPKGEAVPKLSEIKVRSKVQGFINGMLDNYK